MKLFAAFFIALLAVHASTQSPLEDDSSNTKQVVVEILKNILNLTSAILDDANSLLDDFKSNEQEIADKIANFAGKELQALNDILVSLIDELKEGATDQGKVVIACLDKEQESVNTAIVKTIKILSDNLLSEVPLITDLLDVVLRQASELQLDVKLQTDTLETCDSDDATCFKAFSETAVKIIAEVVDNIKDDYDILVTVAEAIIGDIEAWDVRGLIREDIQSIFNEVVECIYS